MESVNFKGSYRKINSQKGNPPQKSQRSARKTRRWHYHENRAKNIIMEIELKVLRLKRENRYSYSL